MVYTFVNRTVALIGVFETPIEIMQLIIQQLGGTIVFPYINIQADVYVIGQNTDQKVFDNFDKNFKNTLNSPVIVYEGKFDDHVLDGLCLGERIDFFKQQLNWYR